MSDGAPWLCDDRFDLKRFIDAQDPVIGDVRAELAAGRKASHWMWFVFPQIAGLGTSPMARRYAITSLDEARAYLCHPVLGPRLRAGVEVVNGLRGASAQSVFGSPDDMKFRSSLTLFTAAAPEEPVFRHALLKYFDGQEDPLTLEKLG